jgi:glycosyltransferase involved in cell wall biosynthesis
MRHPVSGPARVVRVLGSLDVGGAELRTLELLPRLVEAGVEVHFVTLAGRAGTLAPQAERLGATIHPLRLSAGFPVRFLSLLRRLRPRAVHSDVATFSGPVLALAALARVPLRVAHFRSDGDGRPDNPRRVAQRWLGRRLIDRYATDIFGVSPGALRHGYRARYAGDPRCRVVPNGLDLGRLVAESARSLRSDLGIAPYQPICLHLGRAEPAKRRWLIPEMVAAARDHGVTLHAVLVGPGDPHDDGRVRAIAAWYGVADRVHLLGPAADVGTLLRQADVLVLPSDREGLPGVVLEAVALGTPVVASDLPGVRFVAARLAGVTVVPVDAPATAWAEALAGALCRPTTTRDREVALQAFRDSEFSLETAAGAHLAAYRMPPPAPPAPAWHRPVPR